MTMISDTAGLKVAYSNKDHKSAHWNSLHVYETSAGSSKQLSIVSYIATRIGGESSLGINC